MIILGQSKTIKKKKKQEKPTNVNCFDKIHDICDTTHLVGKGGFLALYVCFVPLCSIYGNSSLVGQSESRHHTNASPQLC